MYRIMVYLTTSTESESTHLDMAMSSAQVCSAALKVLPPGVLLENNRKKPLKSVSSIQAVTSSSYVYSKLPMNKFIYTRSIKSFHDIE